MCVQINCLPAHAQLQLLLELQAWFLVQTLFMLEPGVER